MAINADLISSIRRRKLKMTQSRLAELAGVHENTIQGLENGSTTKPHTSTLKELARVFTEHGHPITWEQLLESPQPTGTAPFEAANQPISSLDTTVSHAGEASPLSLPPDLRRLA